jgi:hypothetical protein
MQLFLFFLIGVDAAVAVVVVVYVSFIIHYPRQRPMAEQVGHWKATVGGA